MTAVIRPVKTEAETKLVEQFTAAKAALPGDRNARETAFAAIVEGLPHRRVEDWKYTDLRALMKDAKPLAGAPSEAEIDAARALVPLTGLETTRIVFVNGTLVEALSDYSMLPGPVDVVPLAQAYANDHLLLARFGESGVPADNAAVALNTAFVSDGVLIRIPAGVILQKPIHLAFAQTGAGHAAYTRVLLVVEEGAGVTLIESHTGAGAHQTNSYVEILAGDRTQVTAVKLQDEDRSTQHLATLAIKLGAEAKLTTVNVGRGSALARQQLHVLFEGDNTNASLNGISLSGGRRHLDTTLFVDHASYGCESREQFKQVLDGESRSVFQGKILVRQNAQKTDGRMMMRALMLSEGSEADLKPELEIYADDVQCAHGATCAALEEEYLFYLMARGIPRKEAEAMLIEGFIGDVLETVEDEALRAELNAVTDEWLRVRD